MVVKLAAAGVVIPITVLLIPVEVTLKLPEVAMMFLAELRVRSLVPPVALIVRAPVVLVIAPPCTSKVPLVRTMLLPRKGVRVISPAAVVVIAKGPALVKSGEVTEVKACRVVNLPVP